MASKLIKFCIINHHILPSLKKITTYLDEKPQSRSAKKEITLGSSAGGGGHILEGGKLLLQCHGGCNLKRGVDHLSSGRERIWGRLGGCLHLLGALCLVGISLPRLLQYRQIFAWFSLVHHETDEY